MPVLKKLIKQNLKSKIVDDQNFVKNNIEEKQFDFSMLDIKENDVDQSVQKAIFT